jgi:hypothetical protein
VVTEHYEKDASPLLLSDLGLILKQRNIWPVPGDDRKLRDVIETAHDPDLLIVRDRNSPAYIAVATGSTKEIVERFIERRAKTTATIPNLEALPRPVLLAFCVRQESGKPVFIQKTPPFKYRMSAPSDEEVDQFLLIDEKYRRPGLRIVELNSLSASDRLDLQSRIAAWSRDNDVRLEDFYRIAEKKHSNALERFLAAQPHGLAERILIPGDIALILNKHE